MERENTMKFLKLKKYEVSVWNSMSQNTFHHILLNLQLWGYCLQNKKRTSFHRKPTGHAGQGMRGAIFSFLPVFQFPFSSLIPSFVADHKLRPLLPFAPIPRALDRSYRLPPSPHPFVSACNTQRHFLPGDQLVLLSWVSGRQSSLCILFFISNSLSHPQPCSRHKQESVFTLLLHLVGTLQILVADPASLFSMDPLISQSF